MDMVSWLPSTLPGIILGLGLLSVFLGTPFLRPLYGSMALLIVATVISSMTLGVQVIKGALSQLAVELEEAAQVAGGSAWRSFRDIVVPIIAAQRPARRHFEFYRRGAKCQHGGVNFHHATTQLSLLQLDFLIDSRYESAAVVGIIVVLLTTGVALMSRLLGLRTGIESYKIAASNSLHST